MDTNSMNALIEMRANPQKYPRLENIPREQAISQMSQIVAMAYLYRGMQTDSVNVHTISSGLIKELMEDMTYGARNISMVEVSRAVKKAVLNQENFFISIASLYRVIMDYVKGEGHQAQKELQRMGEDKARQLFQSSPVGTMIKVEAAKMITSKQ